MERAAEMTDTFETKEQAISEYEKYNFTRKVIRVGESLSTVEIILQEEEGIPYKYLVFDGKEIPISRFKVGEMSEDIKKLPIWTQIQTEYLPDSVHISELVRKNLINLKSQPRPYYVLTGIPRLKAKL
jgi:hypothetical protein